MKNKYILPSVDLGDIILREIESSDYLGLYEYGCDFDVVRFLSWGPYVSPREAKEAIKKRFLKRPKYGLPIGYAIIHKADNKMIGTIDYHTIRGYKTVEIGYVINKDYWNRGIVTRALNKVIEIGFEHLGYEKLIIKHSDNNIASRRVIERNRFRYTHKQEREFYNRLFRVFEDVWCYEMTRSEYDGIKSKGNE